MTRDTFENAIIIHAAVGGSTNALLHLPVVAREAGADITIDDFDRIHRRVPVLANVKTTGTYPVEYSLDHRSTERELEVCAQPGIVFLPWSPLGGTSGTPAACLRSCWSRGTCCTRTV